MIASYCLPLPISKSDNLLTINVLIKESCMKRYLRELFFADDGFLFETDYIFSRTKALVLAQ